MGVLVPYKAVARTTSETARAIRYENKALIWVWVTMQKKGYTKRHQSSHSYRPYYNLLRCRYKILT